MSDKIRYIKSIYEKVFEKNFNINDSNSRKNMQAIVFLMQEKGFSIKTYDFRIYKTMGIFSGDLANDCEKIKPDTGEFNFRKEVLDTIDGLKKILSKNTEYSDELWIKCLCYMLYLREHLLPYNSSNINTVIEFEKRYSEEETIFFDHEENIKALNLLCKSYYFYHESNEKNIEIAQNMIDEKIRDCNQGKLCGKKDCEQYPCWMVKTKEALDMIDLKL